MTDADFAAAPDRDGVRVVNVTPGGGRGPGPAARWLLTAAVALGVLAAVAAAVSWAAQYAMVQQVKHVAWVAALEAGIPDVGAVVFAALGVALALHGRRAARPRALNAACIGISLAMNALAAGRGWRDLAIWVMPSAVYALASDTLIGVVRAWVLARARNLGETLADDGATPLAMAGGAALWLLRLTLAPGSTLAGFRAWVVSDCPVAPGVRPGHVAQLEAVRRAADEQITLAIGQRDEEAGRAAAQAEQARGEADRARTAETEVRAELDQVRADARQAVAQALAGASRERAELCAELARARQDAARLVAQVRDSAAAQVAAAEQASAALRAERDRLAAELRAAARQARHPNAVPAQARQARRPRRDGLTKRDRMIELAGQRTDLAAVPLAEVSRLASAVAAEIGYSPGTARRELVRHVRQLQGASGAGSPDSEGGQAR